MPLPLDAATEIANILESGSDYSANGVNIGKSPFVHGQILDFVNKDELAILLKLTEQFEYQRMNNDMYSFDQTDDVSGILDALEQAQFRNLICDKLREFIQTALRIPLTDKVLLTSSRYGMGDYLLCHNDLVGNDKEHRKIAFVLYLSSAGEGGTLDLFGCDADLENGLPIKIEKSIAPISGSLSFFEVSDISYHQVSEILSADHPRVSIHGWFHSSKTNCPSSVVDSYKLATNTASDQCSDHLFIELINPIYLDPDIQQRTAILMNEQGDIMLPKFLGADFSAKVSKALESLPWKWQTPYNQRCYEVVEPADVANCEPIKNLVDFFSSAAMLVTLSNIADVNLDKDPNRNCPSDMEEDSAKNQPSPDPKNLGETTFTWELRRVSRGCYSMLYDRPRSKKTSKYLWASMFFNVKDWRSDQGGRTVFAEDNNPDEVVHVDPQNNSLCLVYAKPSVRPFLLYKRRAVIPPASDHFYQLTFVYQE